MDQSLKIVIDLVDDVDKQLDKLDRNIDNLSTLSTQKNLSSPPKCCRCNNPYTCYSTFCSFSKWRCYYCNMSNKTPSGMCFTYFRDRPQFFEPEKSSKVVEEQKAIDPIFHDPNEGNNFEGNSFFGEKSKEIIDVDDNIEDIFSDEASNNEPEKEQVVIDLTKEDEEEEDIFSDEASNSETGTNKKRQRDEEESSFVSEDSLDSGDAKYEVESSEVESSEVEYRVKTKKIRIVEISEEDSNEIPVLPDRFTYRGDTVQYKGNDYPWFKEHVVPGHYKRPKRTVKRVRR